LVIAGSAVMALVCIYGVIRIQYVNQLTANAPALGATVIQGNIDQSVKWDPLYQKSTLDIYHSLSVRVSPSVPGVIVWPETAMPFYFQDADQRHREIIRISKKTGNWLLFGGPGYRMNDSGVISYSNSAFLLSPAGEYTGRYDKVHLVPYGEYVPLRKLFPFISKLVVGVGDFQAGKGFFPLSLEKHKVGVLICYEGIFPESGRAYKKLGANLLVNITNDAWFGNTSAPYQHLSMTVFRAVENRLFLIRAANTGISAIIDPTGRITDHTAIFERTSLSGSVKFLDEKTFYTLYGDIFVYTCIISLPFIILLSKRRR
jgi:apolipoprotein N-acyltransferase